MPSSDQGSRLDGQILHAGACLKYSRYSWDALPCVDWHGKLKPSETMLMPLGPTQSQKLAMWSMAFVSFVSCSRVLTKLDFKPDACLTAM